MSPKMKITHILEKRQGEEGKGLVLTGASVGTRPRLTLQTASASGTLRPTAPQTFSVEFLRAGAICKRIDVCQEPVAPVTKGLSYPYK